MLFSLTIIMIIIAWICLFISTILVLSINFQIITIATTCIYILLVLIKIVIDCQRTWQIMISIIIIVIQRSSNQIITITIIIIKHRLRRYLKMLLFYCVLVLIGNRNRNV